MGCDIHIYVEKKEDGRWIPVDDWVQDEYGISYVPYQKQIYYGRNYDLFAMLADVRNGYGFAGVDTGNGFIPISLPKGLPDDVSDNIKNVSDSWGCDGHSHSWLTLKELIDYDWNQTTKHRGVVSKESYYRYIHTGKPDYCCGGISGQSIKIVSNEHMKGILDGSIIADSNMSYYTTVEWTDQYKISAGIFLNTVIPKLQSLGTPEDVRIVFWFDN